MSITEIIDAIFEHVPDHKVIPADAAEWRAKFHELDRAVWVEAVRLGYQDHLPPRLNNEGEEYLGRTNLPVLMFVDGGFTTVSVDWWASRLRDLWALAESAAETSNAPLQPEPDGPVPVDGFRYEGKLHCGLTPKPFAALDCIWRARGRRIIADELAENVYGDPLDTVSIDVPGNLSKAINKFFRECQIPLHVETTTISPDKYLSLCDGPPRPKKK